LLHSGTSVGANLEEASAGQSKADFVAKICIARKTAYWLRLLAASGLASSADVADYLNEAEQLVAILGAIVYKARASPKRGQRPS